MGSVTFHFITLGTVQSGCHIRYLKIISFNSIFYNNLILGSFRILACIKFNAEHKEFIKRNDWSRRSNVYPFVHGLHVADAL